MSVRPTVAFAAGAIVALVLGSGTAYAATGGKFKLGYANSASRTTTLTNAYGTAMRFNSKAGQPSFTVNRNVKVPLLNSDLLDGYDSTRFALTTPRLGTVTAIGSPVDTDGDNAADLVMAVATCPAGSQLTGGGGLDATDDGILFWNAPSDGNSWMVVSSTTDYSADNAANIEADARCWNPRANVADATVQMTQRKVTPQARKMLSKVAQK